MEKFQLPPEYDTAELQKLVELFPQFWRESYFDFDEFKAYISGIVPDDLQEKYSFTWHGKAESYRLLKKNSHGTLRPCKEDSVNWDTTQNLYIEGDNLEVLKLIKHTYAGERSVKMIYIDPPYNTGNDFVYDDNFMDSLDKYLEYTNQKGIAMPESSGRYHTKWLNMMYPRLWLANYLLSDDGVIFISIDDNEVTNLRKLCDEVFGEENFVGNIIIKSNPRGSQSEAKLAGQHEYLLSYAKSLEDADIIGHELTEEMVSEYKYEDENGKYRLLGLRQRGGFWRRSERPNLFYSVFVNPHDSTLSLTKSNNHNIEIKPIQPTTGEDGTWRWSKEKLYKDIVLLVASKVKRNGEEVWDIFQKDYINNGGEARRTKTKSLWDDKELNYQNGTVEIKNLISSGAFDYSKPVYLIEQIIKMIGCSDGDIILDFFSGSATTAHAVMKLNAEDNINRRFIMVQFPETADEKGEAYKSGYKNICEIGKERIRRAGEEISKNHPNVDIGFRVFKLDKSNFKIWDGTPVDPKNPSEVARLMGQLEIHADSPFIEGRSHEDIVYEIMRMNNYPLTTTIIPIEINGKTVYGIGEDCDFIICLDVPVDDTAAEELCTYHPGRILFTDSCFKNTETRVNVEHTIKNINDKIKLRVV